MMQYQENYSRINPSILDSEGRTQKARMIGAVLQDYANTHPVEGIFLDIGCSGGIITREIQIPISSRIGTDIDMNTLIYARSKGGGSHFICADGMNLTFKDGTIGVILCNHVYEHVPDVPSLFSEIHRVLHLKGCCYFSAGNQLGVKEPHHGLLFLSWMPRSMADWFIRYRGKGERYYDHLRTWPGIRNLIQEFCMEDYTIKIMKEPKKYLGNQKFPFMRCIRIIPIDFINALYPLLPTWILMLRKKRSNHCRKS